MDAYLQPQIFLRSYNDNHQPETERYRRNMKNRKISHTNDYVEIVCVRVYVCVCVDYISVLLCVVVYVIVSMCVCMMIHASRGRF